ncbi:MAG: hypothetical protein AB7S57_03945 [Acetobacteraceae bacterium]
MEYDFDCLHMTLLRLWSSHERLAKSRQTLDSAARLMQQSAVLMERQSFSKAECIASGQADGPG